ncbi:MAG: hypothetical protein GXP18_05360, partial [Gammaproteobacteria bacterium]|nr:hypothetical protein [Gammaproteobacteria bacterium]
MPTHTKSRPLFLLSVLLLAAALFLAGCSPGDSLNLPTERPSGVIQGNVVDGILVGSRVNVYGFKNGVRGVLLGNAITDEQGGYTIELQEPDQPVLIEASGGTYLEDADGSVVTLADGQVLRAVTQYKSGESLDAMVTPLTHLAVGLAEYRISNGVSVDQAILAANTDINNFFAIDTSTTPPLAITDENNILSELNDPALYGFYLAGLSSWTSWASDKNSAPHTIYSSIALTQILYNDVRSDGVFNGAGYNREGTELMPLAFGRVALDENTFRIAFSLHVMAIANSDENKTGLGIDKLLTPAQQIAAQTGALLDTSDPVSIDGQTPEITITRPADEYRSGLFNFEITIGGLLGAERIRISVDGDLMADLTNSTNVLAIIDTTDYADGEHEILVTATDALGNEASTTFTMQFDNTAPVVNVNSPPASAQATTLITGTYSDNVSGVQSIIVQGQMATLFTDGTWNATVNLVPGENIIPISVVDQVGEQLDTQTVLHLDLIAPVITTTDMHSLVRFSSGDGGYTEAVLQDVNDALPLYFETSAVDLNGVLIDRQELNNNSIPYFAFSVSDQMGPDATTAPEDMQIRIQYERSGEIINPWQTITAINGEYLVPLVSEMLAPDWHQATPVDEHTVRVEVSDAAGNLSNLSFLFRADFYVPAFGMDTISDLGTDIFAGTAFTDRATLNNMAFASIAYTFTNTVGKSFYLSLADDSTHTTAQTVDQLVREHRVNLKTTSEWRIGLMTPTTQCPEMTGWTTTSTVLNFTGSAWVPEQVPAASFGAATAISSDDLPSSPTPSTWSDVPDFDQQFEVTTLENSSSVLTYRYDYILDESALVPPSAYVLAWALVGTTETRTCPSKRYFQQREVYAYESIAGYPQPVLSSVSVAGTPDFATTRFAVTNNDTGLSVEPVSGWYQIPAGHSVTIRKWVTTPELALYNDDV